MATRKRPADSATDQTRFWEKVSVMAEIAALCRESRADRETYTAVLERISPLVPFDAATMFALDSARTRLEECATLHERVEVFGFLRMGIGNGLAGWIAEDGKPVLLSARNEIEGFDPKSDFATVLAVPLRFADSVIGVLSVGCRKPHALEDKHVRLLCLIADLLAVAVERRQYEQKLLKKHRELVEAQDHLKAVQKRLIAQERLAGIALLAGEISHQINNPLSIIVGNAQCLLLEQEALTQKTVSRLRRIEDAALRIRDVNRRLRDVQTLVDGVGGAEPEKHGEKPEPLLETK